MFGLQRLNIRYGEDVADLLRRNHVEEAVRCNDHVRVERGESPAGNGGETGEAVVPCTHVAQRSRHSETNNAGGDGGMTLLPQTSHLQLRLVFHGSVLELSVAAQHDARVAQIRGEEVGLSRDRVRPEQDHRRGCARELARVAQTLYLL